MGIGTLYLLDQVPVEVSAQGACCLNEKIQDVVFLNMVFPDGKVAQAHVSWMDPNKVRKVTLVGSKRMIVFDDVVIRKDGRFVLPELEGLNPENLT